MDGCELPMAISFADLEETKKKGVASPAVRTHKSELYTHLKRNPLKEIILQKSRRDSIVGLYLRFQIQMASRSSHKRVWLMNITE